MSFDLSALPNLVRFRLFAAALSLLGGFLAFLLFLGALFSRRAEFSVAAVTALVVSLFGYAMGEGWLVFVLLTSGRWIALDGKWASRDERPKRFAAWVFAHGVFTAALTVAAGFLFWNLVVPKI